MAIFGSMFNQNQPNPQAMAMQMVENMYRSGKLSQPAYDALRNSNDPKEFANILLRYNVATSDQVNSAFNSVSNLLGSK